MNEVRPEEIVHDFGMFKFDGIVNSQMLQNMYEAITRLGLWSFMSQDPPLSDGYMFWNADEVRRISDAVRLDGHSGSSFAFCMRHMHFIAKRGWDAYVESLKS